MTCHESPYSIRYNGRVNMPPKSNKKALVETMLTPKIVPSHLFGGPPRLNAHVMLLDWREVEPSFRFIDIRTCHGRRQR